MARNGPTYKGGGGGQLPDVHRLFTNRRLGEWKEDASVRDCADDLAAFLTEKGWVVVDEVRRRFIRSVPFWERFVDPFCFSSDGRKLVIRTNWEAPFVVEIRPGGVRWSVRPTKREECMKFEGIRLFLAELHAEYFELLSKRTNRKKSEARYVTEWMSIGKDVDREWLSWMLVCSSPKEAFAWAALGMGPDEIRRWLALGIGLADARAWVKLGGLVGDAEDWINAGWTSSKAIERIRRHGY